MPGYSIKQLPPTVAMRLFSRVGQKAGPFELAPVAGAPRYRYPHPLVGITTKILTHSSNQLTDGRKKSIDFFM